MHGLNEAHHLVLKLLGVAAQVEFESKN